MYAEEQPTAPQVNLAISLSDQLAQAKTPEEKREILKLRYQETLKKDQAIIAARVQRPLSRAYKSLDLTATNEMIETEQQKAAK